MSERVIDVVPGLVRGQKRDGRCVYDKQAKRELIRRCQLPGVSVAPLALRSLR
jgi:transposase